LDWSSVCALRQPSGTHMHVRHTDASEQSRTSWSEAVRSHKHEPAASRQLLPGPLNPVLERQALWRSPPSHATSPRVRIHCRSMATVRLGILGRSVQLQRVEQRSLLAGKLAGTTYDLGHPKRTQPVTSASTTAHFNTLGRSELHHPASRRREPVPKRAPASPESEGILRGETPSSARSLARAIGSTTANRLQWSRPRSMRHH
jgi:hypothetical protein